MGRDKMHMVLIVMFSVFECYNKIIYLHKISENSNLIIGYWDRNISESVESLIWIKNISK